MPPTQLSPIYPSPKRKRDPPHIPVLNTSLRHASTPPRGSPTPDSPRNAVADQLRGMSIAAIPMSPLTPDDVVHKKPKLELMREDSAASLNNLQETHTPSWKHEEKLDTTVLQQAEVESVKEIPETPPQLALKSQQQPRIMSDLSALAKPTTFTSANTNPASRPSLLSDSSTGKAKKGVSEPRSRNKSPSPPLSSLTWQDSEITGHLVDPATDPEDDGTGLNGIGFRPTPAMAQARAQKRRQQLMEWRAREARDARAKRSQRRARGVGAVSRESTVERETPKESEIMKRAVRFAV